MGQLLVLPADPYLWEPRYMPDGRLYCPENTPAIRAPGNSYPVSQFGPPRPIHGTTGVVPKRYVHVHPSGVAYVAFQDEYCGGDIWVVPIGHVLGMFASP